MQRELGNCHFTWTWALCRSDDEMINEKERLLRRVNIVPALGG